MITVSTLPHPSQKQLYRILCNDEEWRTVHQNIVKSSAMGWPIQASSYQSWQEMWDLAELKGAKAFALRKLAKKSYSSFELEKLLKQHLVSGSIASLLIQEFQEKMLLDDNDWIEGFVRKEIRQKLSPRMIFAKLRLKGIPADLIQESIKNTYTKEDKLRVLRTFLEKDKLKDKRKTIAKLSRKGFHMEDILAAFKEYS